jgi:hypothetical protein
MKYFRRIVYEYGSHVDAAGVRYMVDWCNCIYSPENITPEQLGYEPFESMEEALEVWGLTAWVDPEAEKEFLTEQNNEQ